MSDLAGQMADHLVNFPAKTALQPIPIYLYFAA